jgi:hypothetical protein
MDTNKTPRVARIAESEPTAERLPWHAPKLMVERVQRLTGTHTTTSGAEAHPTKSNVS